MSSSSQTCIFYFPKLTFGPFTSVAAVEKNDNPATCSCMCALPSWRRLQHETCKATRPSRPSLCSVLITRHLLVGSSAAGIRRRFFRVPPSGRVTPLSLPVPLAAIGTITPGGAPGTRRDAVAAAARKHPRQQGAGCGGDGSLLIGVAHASWWFVLQ